MIKQGRGGKIIGAASIASKQGWLLDVFIAALMAKTSLGMSMLGAYSSSKFAIRGMTQSAGRLVYSSLRLLALMIEYSYRVRQIQH